ncbi:putative Metallophosphoesterase [uncultured Desulfatiglans sp.]|uniref:Putative Metallophosphoesterase n=1 Tax=Uncultured Desulfatiglans sp. TaxID=1748965 RepID=A0A653A3H1_UNCDX|nr:putative Metallophosphoesterase [uncultured Desulfatiglans sp.]
MCRREEQTMKRRDFLKSMVVGGAAAALAGGGGVASAFWPSSKARAAGKTTLVFISDLHLNVDAPYAWFSEHAPLLVQFFEDLNDREDVSELVILGDMLDDWVLPVEGPPHSLADVLEDNYANGVVPALQALCLNPALDVVYVTGNHDLLSYDPDNKTLIGGVFPGMRIESDAPGLGAYTRDHVIWAEHGHRYSLFNAPDIWSRPGGHLPLGYFISRLAASESFGTGRRVTTPELLRRFLKAPGHALESMQEHSIRAGFRQQESSPIDDAFIQALYTAIYRVMGYRAWDRYRMEGVDGFSRDPLVAAVKWIYGGIFSGWPSRQNIVSSDEALMSDLYLNHVARLLFEMPDSIKDLYPFAPRIILFGHTHRAAFEYRAGDIETLYVNTGTWIDSQPITWVEVEIQDADPGFRSYTVSLWFHGETFPRHSGTLNAAYA